MGFDSRAEALRHLTEIGMREQRHPILYRFKDRVVEWVNLLSVSAVLLFVLGAGTRLYGLAEGAVAALLTLMLAATLLGGYELVRAAAGMNPVGAQVREVIRR